MLSVESQRTRPLFPRPHNYEGTTVSNQRHRPFDIFRKTVTLRSQPTTLSFVWPLVLFLVSSIPALYDGQESPRVNVLSELLTKLFPRSQSLSYFHSESSDKVDPVSSEWDWGPEKRTSTVKRFIKLYHPSRLNLSVLRVEFSTLINKFYTPTR